MSPRQRLHSGFTLIEILFVIIILSVLMALAIKTYRQRAETERINQAALEVQQVLQAAMVYDVMNQVWPENNNLLPGCDPLNNPRLADFISHYLPNGQVINRFGHYFCWSAVGNQSQQKSLFWVAIKVPDHNVQMAKRIAARLPNAITTRDPNSQENPAPNCDESDCYVRAEVPLPGSSQQTSALLAASGNCETGRTINDLGVCRDISPRGEQRYQINFSACPDGMMPKMLITPNFLTMPPAQVSSPLSRLSASVISCTTVADSHQQQHCQAELTADICWSRGCKPKNIKSLSGGKIGASYLVFCVQPNHHYQLDKVQNISW